MPADLPPVDLSAAERAFTEWLCREMPARTEIGDPAWWAPRIWRAVERARLASGGSAAKCPECNGYGNDGDAPCQRCGATGPAPSEGRGAETGWLTPTIRGAKREGCLGDIVDHERWRSEAYAQHTENDRLRAALTAAEAERDAAKATAERRTRYWLRCAEKRNALQSALVAAERRCREVENIAGEAAAWIYGNCTNAGCEDGCEHAKGFTARLSTLHEEGK